MSLWKSAQWLVGRVKRCGRNSNANDISNDNSQHHRETEDRLTLRPCEWKARVVSKAKGRPERFNPNENKPPVLLNPFPPHSSYHLPYAGKKDVMTSRGTVLLSFFSKKVPPHSEKCPLQFSSSFELENALIWLQWDKSSVGHAWLGWMLVEKTSLQPPVGCWVLLWTFSSLRIGPYFCICTAPSTFCPCGSVELQTLPKTHDVFKHCNRCSSTQASKQFPDRLTLSPEFAQTKI